MGFPVVDRVGFKRRRKIFVVINETNKSLVQRAITAFAKGFAMNKRRHSDRSLRTHRRNVLLSVITSAGLLATQPGCIPFVANLIHAVKGNDVPADFDGLEEKKVAVVTVTDSSAYTDDTAARILNRYVSETLLDKVKKIQLVREDEVDSWRDTQGTNRIDYVALGRGVQCDKVVAIEMTNLRLRDGQTMYRGHADVTVIVHDVASNSVEFRRTLEDYTYPAAAAIPITETDESRFRRLYLEMLGQRIARHFHPYDFRDGWAADARIVNY